MMWHTSTDAADFLTVVFAYEWQKQSHPSPYPALEFQGSVFLGKVPTASASCSERSLALFVILLIVVVGDLNDKVHSQSPLG